MKLKKKKIFQDDHICMLISKTFLELNAVIKKTVHV